MGLSCRQALKYYYALQIADSVAFFKILTGHNHLQMFYFPSSRVFIDPKIPFNINYLFSFYFHVMALPVLFHCRYRQNS